MLNNAHNVCVCVCVSHTDIWFSDRNTHTHESLPFHKYQPSTFKHVKRLVTAWVWSHCWRLNNRHVWQRIWLWHHFYSKTHINHLTVGDRFKKASWLNCGLSKISKVVKHAPSVIIPGIVSSGIHPTTMNLFHSRACSLLWPLVPVPIRCVMLMFEYSKNQCLMYSSTA